MKFTKESIKTDSFNMDTINVEVADEAIVPMNAMSAKIDEAVTVIKDVEAKNDGLSTKNDELQKEVDTLKADKETLTKENTDLSDLDSDRIQKMISDRSDMESVADALEIKHTDDKGVRVNRVTLRDAILSKCTEDSDSIKDKEDSYKDARYDAIKDAVTKHKKDGAGTTGLTAFNLASGIVKKEDAAQKEDPRTKFETDSKKLNEEEDAKK